MRGGIDPQARLQAGGNGKIPLLVIGGDVVEDRLQILCQDFDAGEIGFLHVDDDIAAVGRCHLRAANGIAKPASGIHRADLVVHLTHRRFRQGGVKASLTICVRRCITNLSEFSLCAQLSK